MELLPDPDQTGDDTLAGWLAEVEGRLTAIDARLAHLETSLRPAVAEEVHGATVELRRAITELGRRLVTDLPHELARHRDAIVAELRPPPPQPPEPEVDDAPVAVTRPGGRSESHSLGRTPEGEGGPVTSSPTAVFDAPDSPELPDAPEEGRRAPRRRRRHG